MDESTPVKVSPDIATLLIDEARRINSPAFIADDPVQFPRRYERLEDIEIAGLLSATIAWGNRKMICRNCDKMLSLMDHEPYHYVMDEGYEDLPDDGNIHRTFFNRNFKHYLRGLRKVYSTYGSIESLARHEGIEASPLPAWQLVKALNRELAEANGGVNDARCLPQNVDHSALKRVNMWLRWMVRRDGIVDLGAWDVITPAQLFIPLDTHVAATARELGLLDRRSNDRRAVEQLTSTARQVVPDDPVLLDYALFGLGMKL